jgi:hypothetical protein
MYSSTDVGAPVLDGTPGSLINVLDGCLVTGYGSQPSLGWSKVYTGTNRAGYRRPDGFALPTVLQVNDSYTSGTSTNSRSNARVRMIETFTDFDTGFNLVPPLSFSTSGDPSNAGLWWLKRLDWTATASPWRIIGDEKSFIYLALVGWTSPSSVSSWASAYFGQIYPFNSSDLYNDVLTGSSTAISGRSQRPLIVNTSVDNTPSSEIWNLREFNGLYLGSPAGSGYSSESLNRGSVINPNPITGKFYATKGYVYNSGFVIASASIQRGYYRNIRAISGDNASMSQYYPHDSIIRLNGRDYLIFYTGVNHISIMPIDGEFDG